MGWSAVGRAGAVGGATGVVLRGVVLRGVVLRGVVLGLCLLLVVGRPVGARPGRTETASRLSTTWVPPVGVPIADPFRPPRTRYGPGNRGIEYAVVGGEHVTAVAAGRVTFVGSVGGSRFVVVRHPDGLRSTYAFLAEVLVVNGQTVEQGQLLARAAVGFHLTARLGDEYVDPETLFAGAVAIPRLVAGGPSAAVVARADDSVNLSPLDPLWALVHASNDLTLTSQLTAIAQAAETWRDQDCESTPMAPPPLEGGRTLIQIGGLGSSSTDASIGLLDVTAIGYDPADVIGFSYGGGCTPLAFGAAGSSPAVSGSLAGDLSIADYQPADTFQDIDRSAELLAELIEAAAAARPGQPIDLAAHSLGGVVARRAVELLDLRGRLGDGPEALPLRVVLTIGSPHQGTDLATAAVAIEGTPTAALVDRLTEYRGAGSVHQLAEAGSITLPSPLEPPPGVVAVAVAAATDLVVGAEHAVWPGAANVLIAPGGEVGAGRDDDSVHRSLPGRPEVTEALARAAGGVRQRCTALVDLVTSTLAARGISTVEDLATTLLGIERFL